MPDEPPPKPRPSGPPTRKEGTPPGQVVFGESAFIDAAGRETRKAPARPGVPKRIGQYEVVRELGRGGMGVVYLARQPSLGRNVALKVLNINLQGDPEDAVRFRSEAKLAAALRHPNIVQIYEVGEEDGYAFMAMEYVEGGNLYQLLCGRDMAPHEAAALLEPLARAMHYAHQRGIIHRDLKPANVLLSGTAATAGSAEGSADTRHPMADTPKITDFGLAKNLNQSVHLTATGVALGTPSYMAPEQAKDDRRNIGPLSDVYSLGAILYECLTGRPPFEGKNPAATMQQVVRSRPTPPRDLRPDVPIDLQKICLKCLEKNPAKRFTSAEALAEALKTYLCRAPEGARAGNSRLTLILGILLALSVVGNAALFALWRAALR